MQDKFTPEDIAHLIMFLLLIGVILGLPIAATIMWLCGYPL